MAGVVAEADGVALAELVALGPVSSTGHRKGERVGWPGWGAVGEVEGEGAGPPEQVRGRLRMNRGLGIAERGMMWELCVGCIGRQ